MCDIKYHVPEELNHPPDDPTLKNTYDEVLSLSVTQSLLCVLMEISANNRLSMAHALGFGIYDMYIEEDWYFEIMNYFLDNCVKRFFERFCNERNTLVKSNIEKNLKTTRDKDTFKKCLDMHMISKRDEAARIIQRFYRAWMVKN